MARGGKRDGAGRPAGALTKRTREIAEKAADAGITPLDYMLSILRDPEMTTESRFEAAKAAAPYVHAKLAAMDVNATLDGKMTFTVVSGVPRAGD